MTDDIINYLECELTKTKTLTKTIELLSELILKNIIAGVAVIQHDSVRTIKNTKYLCDV